jgi:hypothetical protein
MHSCEGLGLMLLPIKVLVAVGAILVLFGFVRILATTKND